MRIFVTGGTGVLGRSVLPLLLEGGHEVRALAHPGANLEFLHQLGTTPVEASLFEPRSLSTALSGADAVLHLATRIPPTTRVRFASAWAENDRIRREGARNLVDASLAHGVAALIYPSFSFVYGDAGDEWIDAETGALEPLRFLHSTLDAEAEVARFSALGRRGVSLRMGLFYGPESPQTHELLAYARRGILMVVGRDNAYLSSIWVRDAASAVVAALQAPGGIYDVVDDEPMPMKSVAAAIAAAAGRKRFFRPPVWLARLASGEVGTAAARSRRISNRRFKEVTGWQPSVRGAREGWALLRKVTAEMSTRRHPDTSPLLGRA